MSDDRGGSKRYVLVAVVLLSIVALGPVVAESDEPGGSTQLNEEEFADAHSEGRGYTVAPDPDSTMSIWPYTSRTRSVESATLPINVVVLADAELVRDTLIHRPDATWTDQRQGLNASRDPNATDRTRDADDVDGSDSANVLNESSPLSADAGTQLVPTAANATGVYWSEATGSNRYTYVRSGEPGSGRWIGETYQLHDGDYFGTRYHIRFYEVPDGENTWTALQVHREHFDWFRLRHTVGNLPRAQHYVESQFYDQWYVANLHKERFTDGGVLNSDGWATIVDIRYPDVLRGALQATTGAVGFALVGAVGGWASSIDRRRLREAVETAPVSPRLGLMALSIAAIPLSVRLGSIAVERSGLVNSPKVVAGAFYPLLALGLPVFAYVLARGLRGEAAFVGAFVALGVGFLADFSYLSISMLPIEVIVHRTYMMVAIGVVAAAGADRPYDVAIRESTFVVGGCLWIAGLLWALFLW